VMGLLIAKVRLSGRSAAPRHADVRGVQPRGRRSRRTTAPYRAGPLERVLRRRPEGPRWLSNSLRSLPVAHQHEFGNWNSPSNHVNRTATVRALMFKAVPESVVTLSA